jgi:hypothetical protein
MTLSLLPLQRAVQTGGWEQVPVNPSGSAVESDYAVLPYTQRILPRRRGA